MFDLSSSLNAEIIKSFLGVQVCIDVFFELKFINSGVFVVAFPIKEFFLENDASTLLVVLKVLFIF